MWSLRSRSRTRSRSRRLATYAAGSCSPAGPVQHRVLLGRPRLGAVGSDLGDRRTSVAVRPSWIATVRRTFSDTAGSWVTTTMVTPSSR